MKRDLSGESLTLIKTECQRNFKMFWVCVFNFFFFWHLDVYIACDDNYKLYGLVTGSRSIEELVLLAYIKKIMFERIHF